MRLPMLSAILKDANKKRGKDAKINFLKSHEPNNTLKTILKYAFDDNIKFALPEGEVPYEPSKFTENEGGLYQNARKLSIFVEGNYPSLPSSRREYLFIEFLESIHPDEAELIASVKDKKVPYKGITKEIVMAAFPELL